MFFNTQDCMEVIKDVAAWVEVSFELSELAEKGLRQYADDFVNGLAGNQAFGSDIDAAVLAVAKSEIEDYLEKTDELFIENEKLVVLNMIGDEELSNQYAEKFLGVKVSSTEIIDNCVEDEDGYVQPSEISVLVNFVSQGKSFALDFQTTTTSDYGAYSSKLSAYNGSDDYERLLMLGDEYLAHEILEDVLEKSDAQNIRDKYVSENYNVNDDSYGGMDANSETNKATRK